MQITSGTTHFAPELHIPQGTMNIDFYEKFGASLTACTKAILQKIFI